MKISNRFLFNFLRTSPSQTRSVNVVEIFFTHHLIVSLSLLWRCAWHPWANMFHALSATSCRTFSTCQLPWASSPPGTLLPLKARSQAGGSPGHVLCASNKETTQLKLIRKHAGKLGIRVIFWHSALLSFLSCSLTDLIKSCRRQAWMASFLPCSKRQFPLWQEMYLKYLMES